MFKSGIKAECGKSPKALPAHIEALRRESLPPRFLEVARQVDESDIRFTRGLVPVARAGIEAAAEDDRRIWWRRPVDGLIPLDASVYLDGSATCPAMPEVSRAGWAVVVLAPNDNAILHCLYGCVPRQRPQEPGAGELYAFLILLEVMGPGGIGAGTDYKHLTDGLASGRNWCEQGSRRYSALWRVIWAKLEDTGMPHVFKVQGHARKAGRRATWPVGPAHHPQQRLPYILTFSG